MGFTKIMASNFKSKPYRNKKYLAYVRDLPCVVTGVVGCDAHHLIGHGQGGMGTKASDLYAFPLTREQHTLLHHMGWKAWEAIHGEQWRFVAQTLEQAARDGVLKIAP